MVDWNFRVAAGDQYARDMEIHLFIFTSKSIRGYQSHSMTGPQPAWIDQGVDQSFKFLDGGLGGPYANGFNGTWLATTMPFYTNEFTLLKHKVMRLKKPSGNDGFNDPTRGGLYSQGGTIMETRYRHHFKSFPKTWKYREDETIPSNFAPFWAVGYRNLGSHTPDTTGGALIVDCRSHLYWKDD